MKFYNPLSQSVKNSINKAELKRIVLHLAIVAVSAVLAEVLKYVPSLNLGQYQVMLVPVLSAGIKTAITFIEGQDPTPQLNPIPKNL